MQYTYCSSNELKDLAGKSEGEGSRDGGGGGGAATGAGAGRTADVEAHDNGGGGGGGAGAARTTDLETVDGEDVVACSKVACSILIACFI